MSLFILLYIIVISGILSLVLLLYNKYIHLVYGKYLLFGLSSFCLWLLLYLLSFTTTLNQDILLYLSRSLYALSCIAVYSMTLFFLFFGNNKVSQRKRLFSIQRYFFLGSVLLFLLSLFTPFFITGMLLLDGSQGIYHEDFGFGFLILQFLYLINPIITFVIIFSKIRSLQGIIKVRYKYLSFGYLIFLILFALFLAILPLAGIWIMQREQILFFIPFLICFFYASHRYKFLDLGVQLGKVLVFLFSLFFSYMCLFLLKKYFLSLHEKISGFWGIFDSTYFSLFDFIVGVSIFIVIYKFFNSKLLISSDFHKFEIKLQAFKDKLVYLYNVDSLNSFLNGEFKEKLKISGAKVLYLNKNTNQYQELQKYFLSDSFRDVFLNDIVFIEENKNKFNLIDIKSELSDEYQLYIPIYIDITTITGFLLIGRKNFSDYFLNHEIKSLKAFAFTLGSHLKYIRVYQKLEVLSVGLDKKVDEKTIEYNNLLSKQKEFIAYLSHEIRNPITNAIFLCDSLKDSINGVKSNLMIENLTEDSDILYRELIKVGDLVKHIFSTEQFDLGKMKLYRKNEDITQFLTSEISTFRDCFAHISFESNIGDLGIKEIDIGQIRQVINNLISNAAKFANSDYPLVLVRADKIDDNTISVSIEDNGKGFSDIDINSIFDKYTTGGSGTVGLGMGLYLCKNIIELHGGNITASKSKGLGGANFTIVF